MVAAKTWKPLAVLWWLVLGFVKAEV